ncbi:MAG: hypothetical protein ABSC06_03165 [Rhodopila sp.]
MRIPRVDPAVGERQDAFEKLRSATGLLLRAIQNARRAAEAARGPADLARPADAMAAAGERSSGAEMVLIQPGSCVMGIPEAESEREGTVDE